MPQQISNIQETIRLIPRSSAGTDLQMALGSFLRNTRHNRWLMIPVTLIMMILLIILGLVRFITQIPAIILNLFIAPISRRASLFIEFLYPMGIARWGHLLIMKWGSRGRNAVILSSKKKGEGLAMHSRAIEQRTEVVKGRVFIHPLPQLLDNIGYLIVCLPKPNHPKKKKKSKSNVTPILGILVDCGEADVVIKQIDLINDVHYANLHSKIEIHTLLCTHKHHDHTAGNKTLLDHPQIGKTLKSVVGGAIERVPYGTHFVKNGDFVALPSIENNNLDELIDIECIAAPSHTRGSLVFALRNKPSHEPTVCHLFTGDCIFSGGAGVPFEADLDLSPSEANPEKKTHRTGFKPSSGVISTERCFAEVLFRGLSEEYIYEDDTLTNHMLIYPGHEYTIDLLQRQLDRSSDYLSMWNKHQPSTFFGIASHYFMASHRRNLPKCTRLLTVPSTITREFVINPYYRNMRKRGELLLTLVSIWYKNGRKDKSRTIQQVGSKSPTSDNKFLAMPRSPYFGDVLLASSTLSDKSPSSETTWNSNHLDINKATFTAMYAEDLENVINGLKNGSISSSKAAKKLSGLSKKLEEPVVVRRPIPDTLPSEKNMYLGMLALASIGSPPAALLSHDSKRMNLPPPVEDSDKLLISKNRIITILRRLSLLSYDDNDHIVQMIHLLWQEAGEASTNGDLEIQTEAKDMIELGVLKMVLFTLSYNKKSFFSQYCMPCAAPTVAPVIDGRTKKLLKRTGGELVRHDAMQCPIDRGVLGCPVEPTPESDYDSSDSDDLSYDVSVDDQNDVTQQASTVDNIELKVVKTVKTTKPQRRRK